VDRDVLVWCIRRFLDRLGELSLSERSWLDLISQVSETYRTNPISSTSSQAPVVPAGQQYRRERIPGIVRQALNPPGARRRAASTTGHAWNSPGQQESRRP
jgi:hypothetical protein